MTWNDELKAAMPRDEIPAFLSDLQGLVAALREGREPAAFLTSRLRSHAGLVLSYLSPGPARDGVAKMLK